MTPESYRPIAFLPLDRASWRVIPLLSFPKHPYVNCQHQPGAPATLTSGKCLQARCGRMCVLAELAERGGGSCGICVAKEAGKGDNGEMHSGGARSEHEGRLEQGQGQQQEGDGKKKWAAASGQGALKHGKQSTGRRNRQASSRMICGKTRRQLVAATTRPPHCLPDCCCCCCAPPLPALPPSPLPLPPSSVGSPWS